MQVCTSLQTDNHASTPPLCFLQAGCPSCRPTSSVKALKDKGPLNGCVCVFVNCNWECVCICLCREQWHVVSFQHGRWSCSCVVCWRDRAMARASGGWHSTSTDFTAAALKCCAVQWDTSCWLRLFSGLLMELFCYLQYVCVCSVLNDLEHVLSLCQFVQWLQCTVLLKPDGFLPVWNRNYRIGSCSLSFHVLYVCVWVCVLLHVIYRWWEVLAWQFSTTRHWHYMYVYVKEFVCSLVCILATDHLYVNCICCDWA